MPIHLDVLSVPYLHALHDYPDYLLRLGWVDRSVAKPLNLAQGTPFTLEQRKIYLFCLKELNIFLVMVLV